MESYDQAILILVLILIFVVFIHKPLKEPMVQHYPYSYSLTGKNISNIEYNPLANLIDVPQGYVYDVDPEQS